MRKYRILKDPENMDKPFFIQEKKRFMWKKYWSNICDFYESGLFEKKRFVTQLDAERYVQRCLENERPPESHML